MFYSVHHIHQTSPLRFSLEDNRALFQIIIQNFLKIFGDEKDKLRRRKHISHRLAKLKTFFTSTVGWWQYASRNLLMILCVTHSFRNLLNSVGRRTFCSKPLFLDSNLLQSRCVQLFLSAVCINDGWTGSLFFLAYQDQSCELPANAGILRCALYMFRSNLCWATILRILEGTPSGPRLFGFSSSNTLLLFFYFKHFFPQGRDPPENRSFLKSKSLVRRRYRLADLSDKFYRGKDQLLSCHSSVYVYSSSRLPFLIPNISHSIFLG